MDISSSRSNINKIRKVKNNSQKISGFKSVELHNSILQKFLIITLGLLTVFTILTTIFPHLWWHHTEFIDYPLHSAIEAIGALSALLIAFMPVQNIIGDNRKSFNLISIGFLGMGLFDLFHSFLKVEHGFVFTHSLAMLIGGLFFALTVFPNIKVSEKSKYFAFGILSIVIVALAISTGINRSIFPEMLHDGMITSTAKSINIVAAVLFSVAGLKMLQLYFRKQTLGVLLILFVAFVSAITGFVFQYSEIWTDNWWIWHILRLVSFILILFFSFWKIRVLNRERLFALEELNQSYLTIAEREERYDLVVSASNQGVWDWNIPENKLYYSPVWKKQIGYEDHELENIFDVWVEHLHPDDKEFSLKKVQDYINVPSGKFIIEFRFRHKEGHYIWIHNEAASVLNDDGKVIRLFGAHSDITKQKNAENKLLASEEKHRAIFESSTDAIFIIDLEGKIVEANPQACSLYMYEHDELIGKPTLDLIHPDYHYKFEEFGKEIENTGLYLGETVDVRKDGTTFHTEIHGSVINIDSNLNFLALVRDVTQRRESEIMIKNSEAKFRRLTENSLDMIYRMSLPDGNYEYVSPASINVWGFTPEECYESPKLIADCIHPDFNDYFKEEWAKLIEGNASKTYEYKIIDKDGITKWLGQRNVIIRDDSDQVIAIEGIVTDITESRNYAERLKESEEKFRNLFNSVSIPLCHVKEDGRVESMNNRFIEHLGYTLDDIKTINDWWLLAYPDEKYREWVIEKWDKAVADSVKNGTDIRSDVYDVRCKNGDIRQIIIAGITFDRDFLATFIDVTDQLKAEKEILEAKEFSESIISSLPGIFYLFNEEGKFLKWNNSFEKITGYKSSEIPEISPLDLFSQQDRDNVKKAINSVFINGNDYVIAELLLNKETPTAYYLTGRLIYIEGRPHLIGVGIDVSEQRRAEQEREKAFFDLNERIKEISCLYKVNEVLKDIEKDQKETFREVSNIIPMGFQFPELTSSKIIIDEQIFTNENFVSGNNLLEEPLVIGNKARGIVQVICNPASESEDKYYFFEEEKELLINLSTNISNYIQRFDSIIKLEKTLENLERSNKELEQFAYVASHDLQEPLRMVSSYTQLLQKKYKDQIDEKANKYIHFAVDGAIRMQNLITDLLSFSRITTKGKSFEKTDLNKVMEAVLSSLKVSIEETNAKIVFDNLPDILADDSQIYRLFLNLIGNAIKFRKPDQIPEINITFEERKKTIKFCIEDNGIGIDPEFKEKIFVIFQRLHSKSQYSGTGIGLSISKRIVDRHGGRIWVESIPGKGSRFFFILKKA